MYASVNIENINSKGQCKHCRTDIIFRNVVIARIHLHIAFLPKFEGCKTNVIIVQNQCYHWISTFVILKAMHMKAVRIEQYRDVC